MLSVEGTLALATLQQVKKEDLRMRDQHFGLSTIDLLKKLSPGIASLKTRLISEVQDWSNCSKLSMRSGIMLSGHVYQLTPSAPLIKGSDFTLYFGEETYPTVTRFDGGRPILKKRKPHKGGGQKDSLKDHLCSNKHQRLSPEFCSLMMGYPKKYLTKIK